MPSKNNFEKVFFLFFFILLKDKFKYNINFILKVSYTLFYNGGLISEHNNCK